VACLMVCFLLVGSNWKYSRDAEALLVVIGLIVIFIGMGCEQSEIDRIESLRRLKSQPNMIFIDGNGNVVDKAAEIRRLEKP